jgi:hypothetical protein
MKNHYLLVATVSFALIAISGCTSQRENMIKQGYPLPYVDGFDDGCHSGKKAGGNMFDQFKKDVGRFQNDSQYAQGWSDAFRQCESEEEASERMFRMGLEQQRLIEQKKHNKWEEERHLEREIKLDDRTIKYLNSLKK